MSNDEFGERPALPDHPDFWKIAEILRRHDAATKEFQGWKALDQIWRKLAGPYADVDSLIDVAMKRAKFSVAGKEPDDVVIIGLSGLFFEGFVTGAAFAAPAETAGEINPAPKDHELTDMVKVMKRVQLMSHTDDVLGSLDRSVQEASNDDERDAAFAAWVGQVVDYESVTYAAGVRTEFTIGRLIDDPRFGVTGATLWIEGFVCGAKYRS